MIAMKKEHWQEIKAKHPKALNHCIEYFQDRFLDNWRVKIVKSGTTDPPNPICTDPPVPEY